MRILTFALVFALVCLSKALPLESDISFHPYFEEAISSFNVKILKKLIETEKGNIFYSPFSLHLALTQLLMAAPGESDTAKELSALLGVDESRRLDLKDDYAKIINDLERITKSQNVVVNLANRFYIANSFTVKQTYSDVMQQIFKTSTEQVDFSNGKEALLKINTFAKNATNGLIESVFEKELSSSTVFVLLNTIFFKGSWQYKFDPAETRTMSFNVDSNTQVPFQAMTAERPDTIRYSQELKSLIMEFPYKNEDLAMLVVLPTRDADLQMVENNLEHLNLTEFIGLRFDSKRHGNTDVVLPKFEAKFAIKDLPALLQQLGVKSAFEEVSLLSFTNFINTCKFYQYCNIFISLNKK
jgi:serpin B